MCKEILKIVLALLTIFGDGVLVIATSVEKDVMMTLKEKQTLDQFRDIMKPLLYQDYMRTDIYLIRWLRAKNFNLHDAEQMLKENLRWRQERHMDKIQTENFSNMLQELPISLDTQDKEGRPIGVADFYSWDIRNALLAGKGGEALRYLDMLLDNMTLQVFERQRKGMNVTQWKVLANADGFNMVTQGCPICIPYWVRFLSSLETHFPGWLDELIVIDAPMSVYTILEIVKPFLSKHTRDAIRIFGSNKNQWQAYLDQRISRTERRAAYGGTKPAIIRDQ